MKRFVYTQNSRLCSAHFVGGNGPKKPYITVPSLFATKQFKTSMVNDADGSKILTDKSSRTASSSAETLEAGRHADLQITTDLEEQQQVPAVVNHLRTVMKQAANKDTDHSQQMQLDMYTSSDNVTTLVAVNSTSGRTTTSSQTIISHPKLIHTGINTSISREKKKCVDSCTQTEPVTLVTCDTSTQSDRPTLTIEDVQDDPKTLKFYTGIPNKQCFNDLFDELSQDEKHLNAEVGKRKELRYIDEFFLVLMRLRLGLLLKDLADRFCISETTCCHVFSAWVTFLCTNLTPLIHWPSREQVKATLPRAFHTHFPHCRIVIDCTEFLVQRPSSLVSQSLTYSHYKANMTWKALIGITPNGILSFVSDLWLGSISDQQIVVRSGLLELLQQGDGLMGDKGFDISKFTLEKGLDLIIPPKRNKLKRMTALQIIKTRRIASLRIHVE